MYNDGLCCRIDGATGGFQPVICRFSEVCEESPESFVSSTIRRTESSARWRAYFIESRITRNLLSVDVIITF